MKSYFIVDESKIIARVTCPEELAMQQISGTQILVECSPLSDPYSSSIVNGQLVESTKRYSSYLNNRKKG